MKRHCFKILLIPVLLFLGTLAQGQEPPVNRSSGVEAFVKQYTVAHPSFPLGRVYLHTDRSIYLPGDTVWFKGYCWYGQEGEADTLSRVVHTELTRSDETALEKKSYRLKQGQGHGDFILPKTLESGDYYLRGWTRVSSDGTLVDPFYRRFTVRGVGESFYVGYNPVLVRTGNGEDSLEVRFRFYDLDPSGSLPAYYRHELNYRLKSGTGYMKSGSAKLSNTEEGVFRCSLAGLEKGDSTGVLEFMVKDEAVTYNRQFTIPLKDGLDVQFFPEGGDLVSGLNSRVAFKATGIDRHGKPVEGTVEDSEGNTITGFKGNTTGMGSFMLKPQPGARYFARINYQGSNYRFALPAAKEEGIVMGIVPLRKDSLLQVRIWSRGTGNSRPRILLGSTKGDVRYAARVNPVNGQAVAEVPTVLFPEGLAVFTLLEDDFSPQCERVVYIDRGQRIRLSITADSLAYGLRSKVSLTVKATDLAGNPVPGGLSLSVTDRGQAGDKSQIQDIRVGKYLEQEVKGYIEDAGLYFAGDSCNHGALDLLLLTQGYRKFTGNAADNKLNATGNTKTQKEIPEPERNFHTRGQLETGRKRLAGKEMDYRDIGLTLARFGDEPYMNQYCPDSLGRFNMSMPLGNGPFKVLLQANTTKGKPFPGTIEIDGEDSLTMTSPPALPPFKPSLTVEQVQQVQATRKIELSEKAADVFRHIDMDEISVTARRKVKDWSHDFEGEADKVANLDSLDPKGNKYKNLNDLLISEFGAREIMFPGLRTVEFPARCLKPRCNLNYFFPIYVIDGIVYCNGSEAGVEDLLNSLSTEPVANIKKVMVIPYMSSLGNSYCDIELRKFIIQTLVCIETYSNNFYRGNPEGVKTFIMEGLASSRQFYSPRYEGAFKDSPLYDGRATLYWNPEVTTDSSGCATVDFYTGDRPATLDIRVSGMGIDNGAPGEGSSAIRIKPAKQ